MGPEPGIPVPARQSTGACKANPAPPAPCQPQEVQGRLEGLPGAEVPPLLLLLHDRGSTAATNPRCSFPTCTASTAVTFASHRGAVKLN